MKLPTIEEARKLREERKKRNKNIIYAIITGAIIGIPMLVFFTLPGGEFDLPYEKDVLLELQTFCEENDFDDGYIGKGVISCGIEVDYAPPPYNVINKEVIYENGKFSFVDFNGEF